MTTWRDGHIIRLMTMTWRDGHITRMITVSGDKVTGKVPDWRQIDEVHQTVKVTQRLVGCSTPTRLATTCRGDKPADWRQRDTDTHQTGDSATSILLLPDECREALEEVSVEFLHAGTEHV